ncbi:SNF1-interacting protein [Nowakowskiella sp. JEL0407]|nr:SNF1-interacting protein [Nowakowskiella sp. JEL0407]
MGNNNSASSKDEDVIFTVDGGFLSPQGLYSAESHDYNVKTVQKLIAERKIAPFYKGLNDEPLEAENTTDGTEKLSSKKDAAPASIQPEESDATFATSPSIPVPQSDTKIPDSLQVPEATVTSASAPISQFNQIYPPQDVEFLSNHSRKPSNSDAASIRSFKGKRTLSHSSSSSGLKTFSTKKKSISSQKQHDIYAIIPPEELYRGAVECPICFLIKRPESTMEPAECPYCCETHFGITYHPPPSLNLSQLYGSTPTLIEETHKHDVSSSRRTSLLKDGPYQSQSANSSSNSLIFGSIDKHGTSPPIGSPLSEHSIRSGGFAITRPFEPKQRRKSALSYKSTLVVTSDDIRPDWERKHQALMIQRDLQQRRMTMMEAVMLSRGIGSGHSVSRLSENAPISSADAASALLESLTLASRSNRPGSAGSGGSRLEYFTALQNFGADFEDMMLLEAMRRSLIESQPENTPTSDESENTDNADSTEAPPPLPPRTDEELS